ncbi:uncharacterized protein FOMMEDRAFT_157660 [Fomitiporia mediterranea MF3/22]|uniref:uncharacterized protein n=1 Tax=Fomitiporia mediterranea (strain MF3/22) TaxID=694068 RepID=UPI0004409673|nr:uncharacterized protein FOMMEDRAFT_157660 [Fomitiporia mediterranea MF3/22]EJD02448.1 hypothetical protein FOMMEDRAFT_157660 [Fomitiporia mediterranea MF3/22]
MSVHSLIVQGSSGTKQQHTSVSGLFWRIESKFKFKLGIRAAAPATGSWAKKSGNLKLWSALHTPVLKLHNLQHSVDFCPYSNLAVSLSSSESLLLIMSHSAGSITIHNSTVTINQYNAPQGNCTRYSNVPQFQRGFSQTSSPPTYASPVGSIVNAYARSGSVLDDRSAYSSSTLARA